MRQRLLTLFVTILSAALPLAAATPLTLPAGAAEAAAKITPANLRAPLAFLSDDLLEGRGPASRGDRLARLYLAASLQAMGIAPGGPNGSYEQPVPVVGITAQAPEQWAFRTADGKEASLKWYDDYIAGSGVQAESADIRDAELVFVGYAIQAPEYQWDDFKGMDLKGKVLVVLNNDPEDDPKLFEGNRRLYYGRWTYKYESAARQGAAGAIIVHTTPSAGYPFQVVQTSWSGQQFDLPAENEPRVKVQAWATEDAAKRLLALGGHDLAALTKAAQKRDFKPVPLGIKTSISLKNTVARVETANVLGLLEGSDPKLKNEVVVITAHHDHLGIGKPNAKGDTIYNGAVDNASGCAEVLGIARAFAAMPQRPRRSVVFAFVAAEEQGLLGSEYYAQHPTFPAGRIAANINFDSASKIGRTSDLTFLGYGKSKDLDTVVESAAALQDRIVRGDQFPDKGSFYRSDQFNFAKVGVPAVYLDPGTEVRGKPPGWGKEQDEAYTKNDYHQPSDQLDDTWDFSGMVEDSQLGFFVALEIANRERMPEWNAGDEFEAARKKALAAAK